jgi:hypothetical protein
MKVVIGSNSQISAFRNHRESASNESSPHVFHLKVWRLSTSSLPFLKGMIRKLAYEIEFQWIQCGTKAIACQSDCVVHFCDLRWWFALSTNTTSDIWNCYPWLTNSRTRNIIGICLDPSHQSPWLSMIYWQQVEQFCENRDRNSRSLLEKSKPSWQFIHLKMTCTDLKRWWISRFWSASKNVPKMYRLIALFGRSAPKSLTDHSWFSVVGHWAIYYIFAWK